MSSVMGVQNNSIYLSALFQCTNLTIGAKRYTNGISITNEAERAYGGGGWVLGQIGLRERRSDWELRGMGTRPCVRPRQQLPGGAGSTSPAHRPQTVRIRCAEPHPALSRVSFVCRRGTGGLTRYTLGMTPVHHAPDAQPPRRTPAQEPHLASSWPSVVVRPLENLLASRCPHACVHGYVALGWGCGG